MSSVQNQVDPSMILYIENFLDLEENLPNNLARIMTQIHELDTRRIKITKYLDSCLNKYCKNTINDDGKHNLLSKFQNLLIELQDLSDTKICLVQAINDKIDIKSRQLDANYRNAVNAMNANQSHQTSNGTNSNSYSTINGTSSSTNGRTANNLNTSQTPNTSINTSRTEVTNDRNNTSSTTTASSKDTNTKDSNSSNHSNGNSKRTSRRSQGSTKNNNNHDSNGGSGDDRSSTPVASERANSGKKASKRGLKYGLKSDGKRLKASAYYNDSPPNVYDDTLIDPDEPTYCSCNQVSFGEMICCDNSSCPFEWFHFQCVALQTKPKGRWFCPDCRGERSNIQKK